MVVSNSASNAAFVRHALAILCLTTWLGGLTFYALFVVPAGSDVLGSHTEFGFITRRVMISMNLVGSGVLGFLGIDSLLRGRRTIWLTWATMTVCQVALWFLHPWLDALLNSTEQVVLHQDEFYHRHRIYLLTSGVQWLAGMVHFALLVATPPAGLIHGRPRL